MVKFTILEKQKRRLYSMKVQENNVTKLCGLYVSEWHLVTMLLPYLNQKINEQAKIATILEKDIKKNVATLVEKLNLKNKEKILELNWNENEQIKTEINKLEEGQEFIIFVNGSKEFIQRQDKRLEKYFQTHLMKSPIKIINCYEIIEFNGDISEILDKHDKILNTSGEKEITEVFGDYNRKEDVIERVAVGLE